MIPGLSTVKLIGGLIAILMLLGLIAERGRWMHRAHNAEAQNVLVCNATRTASSRPKLDCKQAPQQITFLGDALNAVKATTAAAQAADKAHAIEVESKQSSIGQESSDVFAKQLADVRARYNDLLRRAGAPTGNSSSGRGAPMSNSSSTPSKPFQTSNENRLPPEDALIATEQALQLQAIIEWGKKVGVVK